MGGYCALNALRGLWARLSKENDQAGREIAARLQLRSLCGEETPLRAADEFVDSLETLRISPMQRV